MEEHSYSGRDKGYMKTYVIAPERGTRHQRLLEQLAELPELEVVEFPARMIREVPDWYDMGRARAYNNMDLVPGEIGCAMSHRDLQLQISAIESDWVMVLEDDALVSDGEALSQLLGWIRSSFAANEPKLISLYSEGAVLSHRPVGGIAACIREPSFTVGYCITPSAALLLSEANRDLAFCADWPRGSGVSFYLCTDSPLLHGDGTSSSLIGQRQGENVRKPLSWSNLSPQLIINRLSLYLFLHYFRNRRYFNGVRDYYGKVLRHRILWHLGRSVLKGQIIRPGIYVSLIGHRKPQFRLE
jgi:glycosyl transferase family 25